MADATVRLVSDAANTGKYVDTSELTVGAATAQRQRVNLADPVTSTAIQKVMDGATAPAQADDAAVVVLSPNSPLVRAKFRDLDDSPQAAIKTSAGVLFGLQMLNTTGAAAYIQIFNAAADVTLGTEEPVMEFLVPTAAQVNWQCERGVPFATGIRAASTTTEKGSTGSAAGVMLFAQYV